MRFGVTFDLDVRLGPADLPLRSRAGSTRHLVIRSPGAHHISLGFAEFRLSPNAIVKFYNADSSMVVLPFGLRDLGGQPETFATDLMLGEVFVVELWEPIDEVGQSRLHLVRATHGYRDQYADLRGGLASGRTEGFGSSLSCQRDITCEPQWLNHGRAVGIIREEGIGSGSGVMVNNTSYNYRRFFLTANHVVSRFTQAPVIDDRLVGGVLAPGFPSVTVTFNYRREDCNSGNPIDSALWHTFHSALLRSRSSTTDFALLELKPAAGDGASNGYVVGTLRPKNIYFAGWERAPIGRNGGFGIHHPKADVQKVSHGSTVTVANNKNFWDTFFANGGPGEEGSSGSPLFNSAGRVIGQLGFGIDDAICSPTYLNIYGRFDISWGERNVTPIDQSLWYWLGGNNCVTDDQTNLTRAGDIVSNPPNIPSSSLILVSGAGMSMCQNQPIAFNVFYNGTNLLGMPTADGIVQVEWFWNPAQVNLVVNQSNGGATATAFSLNNNVQATNIGVRVRNNCGQWSSPMWFTIYECSSPPPPPPPVPSRFAVGPNPASGVLGIWPRPTTEGGRGTEVPTFAVRLLDALGREVRSGLSQPGQPKLGLSVAGLPAGTYHLYIEQGGQVEHHLVVVSPQGGLSN